MKLRKILSSVLASAVAVSAMAVTASAVDAQGADGEALIAFADGSWLAQYWADGAEWASVEETTIITGDGSYSVSVNAKATVVDEETGDEIAVDGATDIAFAAVQVVNGETLFPGMVITIDSVELDGKAVTLNGTPYTSSDDGVTTRVNLFNEWATTIPEDARTADGLAADATPMAMDKACGAWTTMTVNFTVTGAGAGAADATDAPAAGDVAADTDSTKGSPDTGVEDVAVVAGLAIVAAGAVLVSKKRK